MCFCWCNKGKTIKTGNNQGNENDGAQRKEWRKYYPMDVSQSQEQCINTMDVEITVVNILSPYGKKI